MEGPERIINGYKLLKRLGEGTFGVTWKAWHVKRQQLYALKEQKEMDNQERANEDAAKEVEQLTRLQHPFIISFVESFPIPDDDYYRICIVMELADGLDLCNKLKQSKVPIREMQVLNWFVQIVLGLAKIHSFGTVHRDIKPMNIFLAADSINGMAKIGHFGSSKQMGFSSSSHTLASGTFLFYSPERFEGKLSPKVDIWALGVSTYNLLTNGEFPFNFQSENFIMLYN